MINLKKKDLNVNLDVNPAFEKTVTVIKTAYAMYGFEPVVTSGKDGKHSAKSAHYAGNALDLRINYIPLATVKEFARGFSRALVWVCGPTFYVVLEKDHVHLEYSEGVPNIKGFKAGKFFYVEGEA